MMTCDKQKENFIKQQQQSIEDKKLNTKNIANTIISHTKSSSKKNKFNKTTNFTNSRMMMMEEFSPLKKVQKQLNIKANTSGYIKEQKQQQQPTIISKVLTQEVSTMAQQAMKQTHMTLKRYFEFSNDAANTTLTKTKATASKRINKNMNIKQSTQKIDQHSSNKAFSMINSGKHEYQLQLRPTFANTTDPADIIPNLATISLSSSSSSPLSTSSLLPPPTAATTTYTIQATEFSVAATIPVTGDDVENSQSKIEQCNNVCISSECGSKQKCTQQQKQKQHCKSANISSSKYNFNNIRTFSKTNINTHITDGNADAASTFISPTQTAAVEGTTNTNIITTTNKANIRFNTISTTTISATATHKHNVDPTTKAADVATAATRPTELSTVAAAATTAYCKVFPLRRRFYQNTKQLECLLRTVVLSFIFVMSMQYQTGK
ncbi:probable basic-leucine zipper transcription factor L [Calliphora vicina]|uniref:probable basic-leucine zipper transcription factor L n=1 Tax=Calliphora vicina TaxID=7373 RepID=UPI00325A7EFE